MTDGNVCDVCDQGSFEHQQVETWMRRRGRWVLFRNVPALVCDLCGETLFDESISQRLARITAPESREIPTGVVQADVFDLAMMDRAMAQGTRPVIIVGNERWTTLSPDSAGHPPLPNGNEEPRFLIRDGTELPKA